MLALDLKLDFTSYQLSVRLDINEREAIGLYGKSGIGKSTLLKVISGLHKPADANICMDDVYWNNTEQHIFLLPQHRSVGMVFQDFALFPNLTVLENLEYAQQIPASELTHLIEMLGIQDILKKKPETISGGQKQRVAIGRSIAYNPKVILMDEPFAALDDEIKGVIKSFLKQYIQDTDKIAIIASHDKKDLEYFSQRIVTLSDAE
ncbi:MAG: ATP-binding cassette domain-containing protein [Reichenbachiella sp.]|uniref:ATP-binding cassette domain-containing protein n=1 Tax=Reichenbachiella sp. TaxID=2184521 RepID=UPI00326588A3